MEAVIVVLTLDKSSLNFSRSFTSTTDSLLPIFSLIAFIVSLRLAISPPPVTEVFSSSEIFVEIDVTVDLSKSTSTFDVFWDKDVLTLSSKACKSSEIRVNSVTSREPNFEI